MTETKEVSSGDHDLAQAAELLRLVDLEARWENLREMPLSAAASLSLEDLQAKQHAHRAFHDKLVAYNRRHTPAHVPELLLNTPARLGKWCRTMRDLCRRVGQTTQAQRPTYLAAKAFRWADRIARRLDRRPLTRQSTRGEIGDAVSDLETVCQWCEELERAAPSE